jgi:lipopolysaccharide biosynthesis glycosyltransferase
MNLLFSIDARYYHQFRAVLTSVLIHHESSPLQVHVLHTDLSPDQIHTIGRDFQRSNLVLCFHRFSPPLNADELLYRSGHIQSLSTFSRVFLEDVLPEEIDRILYLDCDILVRGDLTELWNEHFDGCVVIAARDISCDVQFYSIAGFPEMSGKARSPYFNAGVLLIDVRRFRELKIKETSLDLIRRYGSRLRCYDQDVLNIALCGRWKQMSWTWNFLVPLTFVGEAGMHRAIAAPAQYANPRIVHFIYKYKPWQSDYLGPYREEFLQLYEGPVETGSRSVLWTNIGWALYAFATTLHYFKLSTLRSGIDARYLRLLFGQLVKSPWLFFVFPFFAVYQRLKRGF